jgi:hypothetical protein
MSREENQSKQPELIAYAVSEKGDKTFYHRIGAGWKNKKGYKVILEAFPVKGELLLFPPRDPEGEREEDAA